MTKSSQQEKEKKIQCFFNHVMLQALQFYFVLLVIKRSTRPMNQLINILKKWTTMFQVHGI